MKIKLTKINKGEKFVDKKKALEVGDTVEVTKARGEELIKRGNFEEVKPTKANQTTEK